MANLKELRNKISGIQSIRKVTSAMKLVAGVKLRKQSKELLLLVNMPWKLWVY